MLAIIQQTGDELIGLTPQDNVSTLRRTLGGIDTLTYTIFPQSDAYSTAAERLTEVAALDKQLDEEVFRGRVRSISGKSNGSTSQTITCESAAARLKDSYFNGSVSRTEILRVALNRILGFHNDLTDNAGKVYLGDCPETIVELTKSFDYVLTINVINEVLGDAGLEWRVSYDDTNDRYRLDVAAFFGGVATDPIVIGSNLGSIRYTTDPSGVATRVIPLGGIGYNGQRLTIRTYAGRDSIFIDRADLAAKYGVITRTVVHDDIACDDPAEFGSKVSELYTAGVADAQALSDKAVTWEVSAVDLARAGYSVDTFRVGWYYHIMHPMLGADVVLRLVEMTIDYRSPQRSRLTFGDKAATLTASVSGAAVTAAARQAAQVINLTQIVESRTSGVWIAPPMSQAQYDALVTHDSNTLYIIVN